MKVLKFSSLINEGYSLNPIFVKLYNRIDSISIVNNSDYNFKLNEESETNFASISFYKKIEGDRKDKILLVDKKDDIVLCQEYSEDDLFIIELVKYIRNINMELDGSDSLYSLSHIDYSSIDKIIRELDNFGIWMDMNKYNL